MLFLNWDHPIEKEKRKKEDRNKTRYSKNMLIRTLFQNLFVILVKVQIDEYKNQYNN